jgi:hypothetical protein
MNNTTLQIMTVSSSLVQDSVIPSVLAFGRLESIGNDNDALRSVEYNGWSYGIGEFVATPRAVPGQFAKPLAGGGGPFHRCMQRRSYGP